MTAPFDTFVETGSGSIAIRAEIDRLPVSFVTRKDMEVSSDSLGRSRKTGLSIKGLKLSQKADLPRATIEASGATLKIADILGAATAALNTEPTQRTWLAADLTAADTTSITVKSTSGFAAAGLLWMDSEVIAYTGVTATTFTGLTRGKLNTLAQAHYIPDGAFLRFPEITNGPVSLAGARVRLFAYLRGDSLTGNGTQFWLGMVGLDPRMTGPWWSIMVDPISKILDAEIGSDLGPAVPLRGIYIPRGWMLRIGYLAGSGGPTTIPVSETSSYTVTMQGFWATQQDFLDALNAALVTALTGLGTQIYARASTDGTYHFEIQTGANADAVNIASAFPPNEPLFESASIQSGTEGYDLTSLSLRTTVLANQTYYCFPNPGRDTMPGVGLVPRGYFSSDVDASGSADETAADVGFPVNRLYLGGAVAVPSNTTSAHVSWRDGAATVDRAYLISSVDTSTRSLRVFRDFSGAEIDDSHYYTPANLPTVRLGRSYNTAAYSGTGTYDLMQTIRVAGPDQLNTGAVPLIHSSDFNASQWLAEYTDGSSTFVSQLASQRRYTSLKSVKLSDYVCPDLQLACFYLAFDTDGALTIKPLRLASPTEIATFAITKANLVTRDVGMPIYERNAIGQFNTYAVQEGYDPIADTYTQDLVRVRDVAAYGRSPVARTISVEPKSTFRGGPVENEDVVACARAVLGIFGNPYAYITLHVPWTAFAVVLGSTVSITTAQLPSASGTRGVEAMVGLVVSRELDPYGAKIQLTILASTRRIAGYAPSALISSQVNTSGNTWAITLSATYFVSGDAAANHFEALDRILVYRFDSLTAGVVEGVVVSGAANVVTVTFDGAWVPGVDEWVLSFGDSDDGAVTENQRLYAVVAGSDGRIDWEPAPDASAFEYAP